MTLLPWSASPRRSANCTRILQLTVANMRETNLDWLDQLPNARTLCADVCLRGIPCHSPTVQQAFSRWRGMRLHRCVEEPGGHENGHEGVCVFRFLIDHYDDTSWTGVYFLHGVRAMPFMRQA